MGLKYKRTNIAPTTDISIASSAYAHGSEAIGPPNNDNTNPIMYIKGYICFPMLLNL